MACSRYVEIDDNIPASNISYYVEGDANVANKLTLNLTVYNRKLAGFAIAQFLKTLDILCEKALNLPTPQPIGDAVINGNNLSIQVENRKIEMERKLLENKGGGYHLNFKIEVAH